MARLVARQVEQSGKVTRGCGASRFTCGDQCTVSNGLPGTDVGPQPQT